MSGMCSLDAVMPEGIDQGQVPRLARRNVDGVH